MTRQVSQYAATVFVLSLNAVALAVVFRLGYTRCRACAVLLALVVTWLNYRAAFEEYMA